MKLIRSRSENDTEILADLLAPLNLGSWQYHPVAGSTNDLAMAWAQKGAPDWSLVIADEQTAGRGRYDRGWVTKPGSALAISLVLRPSTSETAYLPRFTALAALGLIRALAGLGLEGQIKWPNDILLAEKKVGGVLVEVDWQGELLRSLVVGMGVNVNDEALPDPEDLRYPAISAAQARGERVDRWALLADTLKAMIELRTVIQKSVFLEAWNHRLAFRDQWVQLTFPGTKTANVKILNITNKGQLEVETADGNALTVVAGEIGMSPQKDERGS